MKSYSSAGLSKGRCLIRTNNFSRKKPSSLQFASVVSVVKMSQHEIEASRGA